VYLHLDLDALHPQLAPGLVDEPMPEREGYKRLDLIAQELGVNEHKVRQAVDECRIEPITFTGNYSAGLAV
jgi:arginase family enzyme